MGNLMSPWPLWPMDRASSRVGSGRLWTGDADDCCDQDPTLDRGHLLAAPGVPYRAAESAVKALRAMRPNRQEEEEQRLGTAVG